MDARRRSSQLFSGRVSGSFPPRLRYCWLRIKEHLRAKYALTDEDLRYVEGREDELVSRISHKARRPREEIENVIRAECGWHNFADSQS